MTNMAESNNIHWAQDEDLLEQFVMRRLTPEEAEEYGKHLRDCDRCRTIVEKEEELIAGIRLAGRDAIKKRMTERLDRRTSKDAMWYRMVGVAAVLILLVTIGIYNNWFISTEPQMEKSDRAEKFENRKEPAQTAVTQDAELRTKETSPGGAAKQGENERRSRFGVREDEKARPRVAPSAGKADAEVDKLSGLEAGNVAAAQLGDEKKDHVISARSASAVETTWIQGTVIPEMLDNRPAPSQLAAKALDEAGQLRKGKEESLLAGRVAKTSSSEMKSQSFAVTQRRRSDLPPSQLSSRQQAASVQTLLQKSPTGMQLTVFLDTLVSQKDLSGSRIQTIGDDSIVVNLGQRRIGYKLPSDWTGQGMQQIKKQK
jgi:hypothetical protein